MRKQWKPTFPPLVPEGSNKRSLKGPPGMCWRKINLKMWRSPLYLLDSPSVTLYCLFSVIYAHFLQTVPSHVIRVDCFKDQSLRRDQATLKSCGSHRLNLSVNLTSESGNESTFSCALGYLGEGVVFELSFTVCPLPFPKHTTHAHALTRARTHSSSISSGPCLCLSLLSTICIWQLY